MTRRPDSAGVAAAMERIGAILPPTPLLPLDEGWLKCESLQPIGAFKIRGAYNRLIQLDAEERAGGAVAFSSGNHAQGVAWAARRLGMRAAIVMPADAPQVKLDATRTLGAEVVLYDRATEDRFAIAHALAAERGAVLVPPFDDADVIEGQGTAGLEAAAQSALPITRVVTPCGGGGLAAGLALALPDAEIVVVEPEGWDDMARSLAAGEIMTVGPNPPRTACDALQPLRVGDLTFATLHAAGARGVAVSENEVRDAMRHAFGMGLVIEPGGAVALAATLAGKVPLDAGTVVIASGGNVDPILMADVLRGL